MAFDALFLDRRDLRREPLPERKQGLARLLKGRRGRLRCSAHFDEPGQEVYDRACRMALEGIVSKRKEAPYISGRNAQLMHQRMNTYPRRSRPPAR